MPCDAKASTWAGILPAHDRDSRVFARLGIAGGNDRLRSDLFDLALFERDCLPVSNARDARLTCLSRGASWRASTSDGTQLRRPAELRECRCSLDARCHVRDGALCHLFGEGNRLNQASPHSRRRRTAPPWWREWRIAPECE